ncbi:MAG: SRPBCC family protein [Syntrophobacteraceae bacterium]
MQGRKAFRLALTLVLSTGVLAMAKASTPQLQPNGPQWCALPANIAAALCAEGIDASQYLRLLRGDLITQSRPVPAGKSGVHVAIIGVVHASVRSVWDEIENCGKSPPIMPTLESCEILKPNSPLPPNRRLELLKIRFHLFFFSINTTLINEETMEAPNYLGWKQVRGEAKINEGYFRIISVGPKTQIVVYDTLVDPGPLVPGFVKTWVVENTLPDVIRALRHHAGKKA